MWNDNDKILEIFNKVENGRTAFPCSCPVCNEQTAHAYFHKHNERHCGIWVWCSNCGAYSHMSGETPKWWKNPEFVDPVQLCAEPGYLDLYKEIIDEWVNSIAPKKTSKSNKPFIMENRFDVILKEKLQNIPAGTIGTIVIKDDFKSMTIEFVGKDGKAIRVNENPDNLLKFVEVVNQRTTN